MSSEGLKPSETSKDIALILGVIFLSQFAFSSGIRKMIFNRDMGKDVWDGSTESLEAAHITHDRSNPDYNKPENGRLLKKRNHYLDHYNRVGRNGLSLAANNAALRLIWNRLSEEEREGLPSPPEEQNW